MKIQIYRSKKNNQLGWRLIARNGKKIACGGETFHNEKDLQKSVSLVAKAFGGNMDTIKIVREA